MTHEEEQIMILSKLNGQWENVGYRFSLACDSLCLEALINDKYSMIKDIATRNLKIQLSAELDVDAL